MSSSKPISRRTLLASLALLPLATACGERKQAALGSQAGPQITVYKSPT